MTRCARCHRRIWPWQHFGFITGFAIWHANPRQCREVSA